MQRREGDGYYLKDNKDDKMKREKGMKEQRKKQIKSGFLRNLFTCLDVNL